MARGKTPGRSRLLVALVTGGTLAVLSALCAKAIYAFAPPYAIQAKVSAPESPFGSLQTAKLENEGERPDAATAMKDALLNNFTPETSSPTTATSEGSSPEVTNPEGALPTLPVETMVPLDGATTASLPVDTLNEGEISPEMADDDPINIHEDKFGIATGKRRSQRRGKPSLRILQIGDSHTAADFFTGEARRILQARYGNGGPGYLEVGRPHAGVRNSAISVSASQGWTYTALQKTTDTRAFYLSGFNATANKPGETLSFNSETPVQSDLIEIELTVGPHQGSIEIRIDDLEPIRRSLSADRQDRIVLQTQISTPLPLKRLEIKTLSDAPVTISSVGIFNSTQGLSYSRVGFPGATVDIINKLDPNIFADDLKRLKPSLIVLAFGTNEGFNDNLDLDQYTSRYMAVLKRIRAALPGTKIVLIAPPFANRIKAGATPESPSPEGGNCGYVTPPNLDRVRARIMDIAKQEGLPAWNWSSIMPPKCGPKQWIAANPKLMAGDHVHFTRAGYELSAQSFTKFLEPMIGELSKVSYALSDH